MAIGAALLGLRLWGESGARGLAGLLATALLLLAVPNASWYVANAALHGDPLFPMLGGNYITGATSDVSIAGLTAAEIAFRLQTDANGDPIAVTPKFLLGTVSNAVAARQLFVETKVNETTTANKPKVASNPHAGMFEPVSSPLASV